MRVITYPDPRLRVKSVEVEDFDPEFQKLVTDMTWTLMAIPQGVGLAAIQIGVPLRLMIYRTSRGIISPLVNPEIIETKGNATENGIEACLSVPGVFKRVPRYDRIRVKFWDRTGNNEEIQWFIGDAARIIQHEIDHLDGKLIVDSGWEEAYAACQYDDCGIT